MQNPIALQPRALALIEELRPTLIAPAFWGRHRRRPADFTRECVLTFPVLMLRVLQKSLKSLQTHAQEFFWQLRQGVAGPSVSAGAVTHARAKLRASAFVELNQGVRHTVYGPVHAGLVQRWHGHRLLGVDSSLVRLPSHAAVGEKFGWVQCANHHGLQERYPQGRVSVFYDVLNEVALEARLAASTVAETELAHQHLACVQPGDLVLNDRGFTGYRWLVAVRAAGAHFVSRCSRGSFAAVQRLFARDQADVSVVVTLAAPPEVRAECRARGWPLGTAPHAARCGCLLGAAFVSYLSFHISAGAARGLSSITTKGLTRITGLRLAAVAVQFLINGLQGVRADWLQP